MTEQLHWVDTETCKGDGICVDICPEEVLSVVDGSAATIDGREDSCILCGQCVAVCPTESIQMPKLPAEDFNKLAALPFGYDELLDFLKLRRSVRVFKDRPVERDVVDKILAAAATAPMGLPPHSTEVVVVDRHEELDFLLEVMVRDYESTVKAFGNPVGRTMIRLAAGADAYGMLKSHIVNIARENNESYRRDGTDRYLRGAPMLMLFHANRHALSFDENAHLVCHHAMLAAISLGLGTTIIGLVPPIVDRSEILRKRYGIPKDNRVLTSLILGYPKYKYKKSIRRDLAGVRTV
jgi:NAD-dependent dihydropyrimidine dehydrogenase PreA subunit/nitroreductase